jgi:hypothetical protein
MGDSRVVAQRETSLFRDLGIFDQSLKNPPGILVRLFFNGRFVGFKLIRPVCSAGFHETLANAFSYCFYREHIVLYLPVILRKWTLRVQ